MFKIIYANVEYYSTLQPYEIARREAIEVLQYAICDFQIEKLRVE